MDDVDQRRAQRSASVTTFPVIESALKTGAVCGGAGFIFGGAIGIIRGVPPFLFAAASTAQVFTLATIFTGTRDSIIHAWTREGESLPRRDLTKASAIAGSVAGGTVGSAVGFLARRRANPLPGAFMFAIIGAAGQHLYNGWSAPKEPDSSSKVGLWKRLSEKSWSPVKIMNDHEYAELLREKMLKLDVEISVLDDKIEALRNEQRGTTRIDAETSNGGQG